MRDAVPPCGTTSGAERGRSAGTAPDDHPGRSRHRGLGRRRGGKRWPALNFRVCDDSCAHGEWRHCATSGWEERGPKDERYATATFFEPPDRPATGPPAPAAKRMGRMRWCAAAFAAAPESAAEEPRGNHHRTKGLTRGGADEGHDGHLDKQGRRPGGTRGNAARRRDAASYRRGCVGQVPVFRCDGGVESGSVPAVDPGRCLTSSADRAAREGPIGQSRSLPGAPRSDEEARERRGRHRLRRR